jgi:hypothetical protein
MACRIFLSLECPPPISYQYLFLCSLWVDVGGGRGEGNGKCTDIPGGENNNTVPIRTDDISAKI